MDLDQLARTVKDLEYRIKLLEKAQERPIVVQTPWCGRCEKPTSRACGLDGCENARRYDPPRVTVDWPETTYTSLVNQFCACGKDKLLCRAPDCPSHKPDPMGR